MTDQDVVVLRQLSLSDLLLHLPVGGVHICMQARLVQLGAHLLSVFQAGLTDWNHHHLHSSTGQMQHQPVVC